MTYMDPRPEGLNTEKAPESIVEMLKPAIVQAFEASGLSSSHAHRTAFAAGWNAAQQKWQPIETAPMDGTHVLTWNGRWIAVSYWSAKDFYNAPAWHDTRSDVNHIDHPTHWMPLPAAPNDEVKNV